MSGKVDKFEQLQNKLLISITLFVFHCEISGKVDKFEHL